MKNNTVVFVIFLLSCCCGEEATDTTVASSTSGTSQLTSSAGETSSPTPDFSPWYSTWFVQTIFTPNKPYSVMEGGLQLFIVHFDFTLGEATIQVESCDTGVQTYYYLWSFANIASDNRIRLTPSSGSHQYPSDNVSELYVVPGDDCSTLEVVQVSKDGQESSAFAAISTHGLFRGNLCLEKCIDPSTDFALISDCGATVPWDCSTTE